MIFPFENNITDINDLREVCKLFAAELKGGETIALIGDLGTGKTTFTKILCELYDIYDVDSPSFALVNEYYGKKDFYHFDFYRIEKEEELFDLGFDEYINNSEFIKIIEWADMFEHLLPANRYQIKFNLSKKGTRTLLIEKYE